MKKYFVVDQRKGGDCFGGDKPFNTAEEAIQEAEMQWNHMTETEKQRCEFFHVAVCEPEIDDGKMYLAANWDIVLEFPLVEAED